MSSRNNSIILSKDQITKPINKPINKAIIAIPVLIAIGIVVVIVLIKMDIIKFGDSKTEQSTPPTHCVVSEYGPCINNKRIKTIITEPSNGGNSCPQLNQSCSNCVVSEYGPCINNKRIKTIITEPTNGGNSCPPLNQLNQYCSNCIVSEYGPCINNKRIKTIITEPTNGGDSCPPLNQSCSNCVGDWTTWSDCGPIENNESIKFRTYKIEKFPLNGGTNCNIDNDTIENLKCELNIYPPIKEPSAIFGDSTNISVEYDNDAKNKYQIRTSYTYENWGSRIQHLVDNNISTSWTSLYNVYFLPPNYSGSNFLVENTKGEWIYYKLPKQINLYKYTISSVSNRPRTWVMYGSNDGIIWTEISNASQKEILSQYNSSNIYTKILDNKSDLYQYFGIVITSINGGPGDYAAHVSDIRFYGI
jgi:hypothetical protein